jgi:enoyl-CoA hydratase/carnithine racemase
MQAGMVQMMADLVHKLQGLDEDEDIHAIIITGSQGYFSVGVDIHELAEIKTYGQVCTGADSVCGLRGCVQANHVQTPYACTHRGLS